MKSFIHTSMSAITLIVVFFVMQYFVTPLIEWAMNMFGLLLPGNIVDGEEPGLIRLLVRGLSLSVISSLAAFAPTYYWCHEANLTVSLGVFALTVLAWAGFLASLVPTDSIFEAALAGYLPVAIMALPPLVIAFVLWKDLS